MNTYLLDPIWLKLISIRINADIAQAIVDTPPSLKEYTLVWFDGKWRIAGSWGITDYEYNTPPSAFAPNIAFTQDVTNIVQTVALNFPELILHFVSIEASDETATVYVYDGYSSRILTLTAGDGTWQIAGTK
jgi:hypothetical protein